MLFANNSAVQKTRHPYSTYASSRKRARAVSAVVVGGACREVTLQNVDGIALGHAMDRKAILKQDEVASASVVAPAEIAHRIDVAAQQMHVGSVAACHGLERGQIRLLAFPRTEGHDADASRMQDVGVESLGFGLPPC